MLHAVQSPLLVLFGVFFLYCAVFNVVCLMRMLMKKPSPSLAPLVGGFLGAVALYFSPMHGLRPYWWAPLLLDCSWPVLLVALLAMGLRRTER